ncbi:hypothetical protein H696_05726 [Fonticula alba]|uniref:t-SNARE coiled-coil homology domain-containing protein n=1 Tax=Fonticula alba TaxID=691883 RepID=A0A058Z0I6_FONAL|nr:hypothetical protein H696_05726 [Fonticula alba]KCV67784.1 hypothetical protein H696_05726 [Fonticula alba]|eukprot:XP_009497815.1 hypothetical protein H696_05726 [Fonticula alba]
MFDFFKGIFSSKPEEPAEAAETTTPPATNVSTPPAAQQQAQQPPAQEVQHSQQSSAAAVNELTRTSSEAPAQRGPRRRQFGAPAAPTQETTETLSMDNRQLLEHSSKAIAEQDAMLDQLYSSVVRQKEISMAINTELDTQNRMLDDLSRDVDSTQARLHGAQRTMNRIS